MEPGTAAVGFGEGDKAGLGDGGTTVAVDEAIGEGGIGVGVLVGADVGEPDAIEADSRVEKDPDEERHAARNVPAAVNPRLTKRRLDMRPNTVVF